MANEYDELFRSAMAEVNKLLTPEIKARIESDPETKKAIAELEDRFEQTWDQAMKDFRATLIDFYKLIKGMS